MRKIFFTAFIFFLLSVNWIFSQERIIPHSNIYAKISLGGAEASSYYGNNGGLVSTIIDTESSPYHLNREFVSEIKRYFTTLYAEYAIAKNFSVNVELPLNYWTLSEKYLKFDTLLHTPELQDTVRFLSVKKQRTNISQLSPNYFGVGGRYFFSENGKYPMSACLHMKIPSNANQSFVSNLPIQTNLSLEGKILFSKAWIGSRVGYSYRGENFSDEIILHAEGGITTVPTTEFILLVDFVESTGRTTKMNFNTTQFQERENFFRGGGNFTMYFGENFFVDANYSVRLFGVNSWAMTEFRVGFGWKN